MKYLFTLSLFAFFLAPAFQANAQTKEDLVQCLEVILDLPEVAPLFQHDLSEGKTIVLLRPSGTSIGRTKDGSYLLNELTEDDFRYFRQPVKVMTREEAAANGIAPENLTTLGFGASDKFFNFMITSSLKEEVELFNGAFSLEKKNNEWILTSKNVRTTKSR